MESKKDGKFDVTNTFAEDLPSLVREISILKPSVIVIDEVTSFIKPAELIVSLLNTRYIRLIVLNSQTSKMDIYDKSVSMVSDPGHFIEALNVRVASS